MTLPAGTPIGKYLVRRKLAEGGMAEIYLCSALGPEGFEKEVVIKRIRSFLANDADFVRMFIAEAQLASKLNHPNIVQIFDFEKHQDTYYLAMEYVKGHSLSEVRKRCREVMAPIPPTLVAHIGGEIARGLHHAHRRTFEGASRGVVHRDVSPHNVLLSFDGAVKLTDFGIAKAGTQISSPGVLKGKFAYMSPEQARGEGVDARSDIFALGIVLWELVTGGRLFEADNDVAVLQAVQQRVISPPARINPKVLPELDAAIVKALQRSLDKRFQTALEMERALAQYILNHAKVEDLDVGAFLRRLFPEEVSGSAESAPLLPVSVSINTTTKPEPPIDLQEVNTIPERPDTSSEKIYSSPSEPSAPADPLAATLRPALGGWWAAMAGVLAVATIVAITVVRASLYAPASIDLGTPPPEVQRAPADGGSPLAPPTGPIAGREASAAPGAVRLSATEPVPALSSPPPAALPSSAVPGPPSRRQRSGVADGSALGRNAALPSSAAPGPASRQQRSGVADGSALGRDAALPSSAGKAMRSATSGAADSLAPGPGGLLKNARRRNLIIDATPWAEVFVNEKKVGDADPHGVFSLPARRHRLRLQYKDLVYETDVDLRSSEAHVTRHFLAGQ